MSEIKKFNLQNDTKKIYDYYNKFGYVVINSAIKHNKIDEFMKSYKSIKNNPFFVYYSQSLHIAMKPILNKYSYIKESMQNASRLAFFKKFCKSFQSCIYDENISKALSCISNEKIHVSWQNMFFDKSVGTIEHQDSWYLDTNPPGDLIGVWYALEDIHDDSGPFFVIPSSHKVGLLDRQKYPNHDDFVKITKKTIDDLGIDRKPMYLKKGDILLWHPYLIHGAFQCKDESKSRKSFTSHFYPNSAKAKDTEKGKLLSIYNHFKPKRTINTKILSAYRFSDYFYNILVYVLYVKNTLIKSKSSIKMGRESYS